MIQRLVLALAACALLAGAYKLTLAEPQGATAQPAPTPKVAGAIVVEKQVLVDLKGGGYATVTVGLEVPPEWAEAMADAGLVRDVITRDLTNIAPDDLRVRKRRDRLKLRLARDITERTDVQVARVLLTDFTIR